MKAKAPLSETCMRPKMLHVPSQGSWDSHTYTHVHTLWPRVTSPDLQQGRQCRQETHIPRGSHTNHSPTQSEPWDRPQIGLFSALAALGNGDNMLSLTPYPSPWLHFFLPVSLGPWSTSPCPAQPAHSGDTAQPGDQKSRSAKNLERRGKEGERSCLLLARTQGDGPDEPGGPRWRSRGCRCC